MWQRASVLSGCFGGRFDSEDIGAVASEAFVNIIADLSWRTWPRRVYKPIESILGESVSPFRHRRRIAALIGGGPPWVWWRLKGLVFKAARTAARRPSCPIDAAVQT